MNQIPVVFFHTTTQLVTGVVAGTLVDGVFPEPGGPLKSGDWKSFTVLGAEVTGQLIINGLMTVALLDAISSMPDTMKDATMGGTHTLALMYSQPKLGVKMNRIGAYTRNVFANLLGIAPEPVDVVRGSPNQKQNGMQSQKQIANAYM